MPPADPAKPSGQQQPFRLRGTNFNLVVLQLLSPDAEEVATGVARLLRQAPATMRHAPIVLGLDELAAGDMVDLPELLAGLRALHLMPVGVAGGTAALRKAALDIGMPVLPKGAPARGGAAPQAEEPALPVPEPTPAPTPAATSRANAAPAPRPGAGGAAAPPAMLVTNPVRSGRRIYAERTDLIVTATVNPGAELIADGNIHVYGALHGRAIAGAAGREDARIFALHFDPELVSISGLYRVRENLDQRFIGKSVQLRLEGDRMCVDLLG